MSKLNLIIDTNHLFHKTIHISKTYSKSKKPFLSSKNEKEQFIRKVATDLVHDIKTFSGYNKIVFCVDSKSWRKKIYSEYKGNRTRNNEEIDWTVFNECIQEFTDIVKSKGCIVSCIDDAEADDLIFLWSRYFLKQKENSVVISADRDLTQLVDYNQDNFVIVYNNNSTSNKLISKNGFSNFLKSNLKSNLDVFDFETDESNHIGNGFNIINKTIRKGYELVEIDPDDVVFEKVLSGDKSDNIISAWTWKSKTGSRTFGISDNMSRKIKDAIGYFRIHDRNDTLLKLIHTTAEKITNQTIEYNKFLENVENNYQLISLKLDVLPKHIINKFKLHVQDTFDIYAENFNRIDLLKNTKYEKEIEIVSDIFNSVTDEDLEEIKWT